MGAPSTDPQIHRDAHELVRQARQDSAAGALGTARVKLEAAVTLGYAAAYADLADIECRLERYDSAEEHLRKLTELANASEDPLLHLELSGAFQMMLGSADRQTQERRAIEHLSLAARLGHPSAQATLAHWYHYGLNGVEQDTALFEHWVKSAADAGDPLAACEYGSYLLAAKRPLPSSLVVRIHELAPNYAEAKNLLRKLSTNAA
jgi:TPR repeat protein